MHHLSGEDTAREVRANDNEVRERVVKAIGIA